MYIVPSSKHLDEEFWSSNYTQLLWSQIKIAVHDYTQNGVTS